MKLVAVLIVLLAVVQCQESPAAVEERKAKLEKLKTKFDAVLDRFEDRDSAHICVALVGKADLGVLVGKLKAQDEFISLEQSGQAEVTLFLRDCVQSDRESDQHVHRLNDAVGSDG
jgi:type IV secretory pathway VirD2 relaxase